MRPSRRRDANPRNPFSSGTPAPAMWRGRRPSGCERSSSTGPGAPIPRRTSTRGPWTRRWTWLRASSMDRPLAVLSDFDGTITVEDVAEVLLARFATGEWEEIERLNRAGVLGTRETMARQFAIVHATREELVDCFRREARMDPTVPAFFRFCRARGIPVEVVSEGLDFYVDELMKMWRLDVPVRTNRAVFVDGRIRIEYPYADPTCTLCGTCKLDRVFQMRVEGHRVVYVGDGDSDLCPALEADEVFAKGRLAELCEAEGIRHHRFRDF